MTRSFRILLALSTYIPVGNAMPEGLHFNYVKAPWKHTLSLLGYKYLHNCFAL